MKLKTILHNNLKDQKRKPNRFFETIKDSRNHKELVIIATGPTVTEYSSEQVKQFCVGKDVFGIKQAIDLFSDILDVHFFNCSNLPIKNSFYGYKYEKDRPFVVSSSNFINSGGRWSSSQIKDLFFKIPALKNDSKEFLFTTREIEKYLLSNCLSRPCGPGIFFETVIFFAIHLGYKKIYTLGWDYCGKDNLYGHFYNDGKKAVNVRIAGDIFEGEIEKVLLFTDFLAEWLESKQIELKVIGRLSKVTKKFKRIDL